MTDQTTIADTELLLAYARERSADAFAQLVHRYAGLVYNVGLRITRNREDAQDIAQECFLQLAAHAARITQPLPAWLHTLARSRAIDLVRRRSARHRHEQQIPRPDTSPLSLEQWNTLSQQVDQAIAELPEEMRICLVGLYLQGRTQQELAGDLGVAQGTVSRRIERAVDALRDHLRQAGVDVPAASMVAVLSQLSSSIDLPANLVPELTKMGLSGVGTKAAAGAAKLPLLAAGIALVALITGIAFWALHTAAPAASQQTAGTPTMNPPQAAPQSSNQPNRQNNTASIQGLQPGQSDTNPYSQGLSILLQHLGQKDATYTRVMGYSGVAFALQMDLSGPIRNGIYDVAWWPNDCYAFDMRINFLGQAFGRELRKIVCDPTLYKADVSREYQTRFESAIVEAINQGYPVLGQQDSAVLVTGYDLASHKPLLLWPSPGQPAFGPSDDGIPWAIYVPGKAISPLPQSQAELQSLQWAVSLWDESAAATVKDKDTSKILTGSKAYATWLQLLQQQANDQGLGRDSWDNNMIFHLSYNRTAAAAYLRDLADHQPPSVASHLRIAADLYQQVADDAARAPLWGQFAGNPEARPQKLQEYTDIIRQASQYEAQAIDEIRQAIANWPQATAR